MELTSTSSGVPIQRRICGVKITPITVSPTPATRPSATVVDRAAHSVPVLGTEIPRDHDARAQRYAVDKAGQQKKSGCLTSRQAASASPPRKLPTISESAALYSCWNRLLIKNRQRKQQHSPGNTALGQGRFLFCFHSLLSLYPYPERQSAGAYRMRPTGVIRRGGFHIRPQSAVCLHQHVLNQ